MLNFEKIIDIIRTMAEATRGYSSMVAGYEALSRMDPVVWGIIVDEAHFQDRTLKMIPSENYPFRGVLEALATPFAGNYAEGFPGARYYQGQANNDRIEDLTVERAKGLLKVPEVIVQPLSGSPANAAVQMGLTDIGGIIMGLSLSSGGHLSHGADHTFSSRWGRSVQYKLEDTELIDYDRFRDLAIRAKPDMMIIGISSYPRQIDYERISQIAEEAGKPVLVADISHTAGLVVGGVHKNPAPFVDVITTTTHKTLRGPRGAIIAVTERGLQRDPDMAKRLRSAVFPGLQGGPHMETITAMAVAFGYAAKPEFAQYAQQMLDNSRSLAQKFNVSGRDLLTGGTDNHLLVMRLRNGLLGNTVAEALEEAGIVINRNAVPGDEKPYYPTGIRIGTPAVTTRGMQEPEMESIAELVEEVLTSLEQNAAELGVSTDDQRKKAGRVQIIKAAAPAIKNVRYDVELLTDRFPIPLE